MNSEKKTFKITSDDGRETECTVLAAFTSPENGRNYIVYTDGDRDALGKIKVYASRYSPEQKDSGALLPITTEQEWKMIETVMQNITQGQND